MHHRSAISYADAFKYRECYTNVLLPGIWLTAGVAMIHNLRFIFGPKSTRTELIECNIYSSVFRS